MYERTLRIKEYSAEKIDLLDSIAAFGQVNTVADIEGVLDEQKDDTRQNVRQATTDEPTETCKSAVSDRVLVTSEQADAPSTNVPAAVITDASCAS